MSFLSTDKPKPQILDVRITAQTKVFQIQSVDLQFANGQHRTYERLTPSRRPAVMVMAVDGDNLLMVREYAVGSERYELGCVKGLIDAGETPEQAALRELQEEIGLGARQLEPLRMFYVNPSHMFGPMYAFVARDLYPSVLEGDEPEPLEIVRVPLARLDELIDDDQFGDARTLAALMLLQRAIGTAK